MPNYTRLKGTQQYGDSLLIQQLETNLVAFFRYGCLEIGGFYNVIRGDTSASGSYGANLARLRPVSDPNFVNGQVWEGFRQDWVWESGLDYHTQPIQVSGVWVNGTFQLNSGQMYVNYPLGRVIFNTPIATTSIVEASYSYNAVNFTTAAVPWFRQLMFESFRPDRPDFLTMTSGNWYILGKNRVQLPAVVVEAVPSRRFVGYELGGGHWVSQDVFFHIYAETPWDCQNLIDLTTFQHDKTIFFFDINRVSASGAWPLTVNGSIADGARTYPQLVADNNAFRWKRVRFDSANLMGVWNEGRLHRATTKLACIFVMPQI